MNYALITGATSGIGKEMAIYLHKMGWKLILTGRNEEVLKNMAQKFGNNTKYIALDLAKRGSAETLYQFCQGLRVDFLINNAGFGVFGNFTETSLEQELELIEVNIRSLHILTKLFLRDMVKRDCGQILNVGSVAGFMTGPLLSSYYASKNYVVRLTTAIREELRRNGSNVKIAVLAPGPVDTNFNNRAGVTFSVKPINPKIIAEYGIDKALEGRCIIIPHLPVRICAVAAGFVPESIVASVVWHIQKAKAKV